MLRFGHCRVGTACRAGRRCTSPGPRTREHRPRWRGSIAAQLVAAFDRVFKGPYDDGRAIHAKGIVLRGDFTADPDAISLTSAAQFQPDGSPVPVIVRFSEFSGIPSQIDGRPGTNPTGMAIKFAAARRDRYRYRRPFLQWVSGSDAGGIPRIPQRDSSRRMRQVRDAFLAAHPAARQFIDDPKPTPVSYATETYYGVDAFRFVNAAAVGRFGRYRIEPVAGAQHLSAPQAAGHQTGLSSRRDATAAELPGPRAFACYVQLAAPEDDPSDATKAWPADRPASSPRNPLFDANRRRDRPRDPQAVLQPDEPSAGDYRIGRSAARGAQPVLCDLVSTASGGKVAFPPS